MVVFLIVQSPFLGILHFFLSPFLGIFLSAYPQKRGYGFANNVIKTACKLLANAT